MQPINYLPQNSSLDADLMQGLQLSQAVRQIRQQRSAEQEALQYRDDLTQALSVNDPQRLIELAAKYPKQGAGLKQAWEMLGEEQRKSELGAGQQAWYAINSGRPDVALGVIDEQIAALKNSNKDPSKLTGLRTAIEQDPSRASQSLGLFLSTVAPKEFAETFAKINEDRRKTEQEPAENRRVAAVASKAESDAESAAVAARFAESNAVKDLEKKGWDIKKIQSDINIAKENTRIAAMNSAIAREGNVIKREELKLKRDEAVQKRDEQIRGRTAEVENARFSIDNFLNTADRIINTGAVIQKDNAGKEKIIPNAVARAATGPLDAMMPTLQTDVADFEALIENLGAQAFMSQIPQMKGAGALSDAEGKKLAAALQNFSLKQSPERLVENVREAQRLMMKARKTLAEKHGVPDSIPDTPAAKPSGAKSTDDMLRELGVLK